MAELLAYYDKHIGQYPYKQYSVIQGGDGGMEYAMCTLITGDRKFGSLVGVTAHEFAHTWFQFLLASNETKNEWMDEGFTTYISTEAMNEIMDQKIPIHRRTTTLLIFVLQPAVSSNHRPQMQTVTRITRPIQHLLILKARYF